MLAVISGGCGGGAGGNSATSFVGGSPSCSNTVNCQSGTCSGGLFVSGEACAASTAQGAANYGGGGGGASGTGTSPVGGNGGTQVAIGGTTYVCVPTGILKSGSPIQLRFCPAQ